MVEVRRNIGKFENAFGGVWIPVKFCETTPDGEPRELRFCEAIAEGRRSKVVLTPDSTTCLGAKRSFGWESGADEDLASGLAEKQSVSLDTAKSMIGRVPQLDGGIAAVEVSTRNAPDVLVSFAQAPVAMSIARAFEKKTGGPLDTELSSILSVCGNVAVGSLLTGRITLSMGCETSRECGAIGRDRFIMGVPWSLALKLLEPTR